MTTINVTQQHIDKGCRIQASNCPIALAIDELLKEPLQAWVCQSNIGIGAEGEERFRYQENTPESAKEFITRFDAGEPVEPFSFDLDIPAEFLK